MTKLILCSLMLLVCALGNSQNITELEEAKVNHKPMQVESKKSGLQGTVYQLLVQESYVGEFEENPFKFMQTNFDIKDFISYTKDEDHDRITVFFRTRKGAIKAIFNHKGELQRTAQNFKNIVLPRNLRYKLYKDYKGWNMVTNTYKANGTFDQIENESYHIKLKRGNETRKIVLENTGVYPNSIVQN